MSTTHHVDVEVVNGLGSVLAVVDDETKAVLQALLSGDLLGDEHKVAYEVLLVLSHLADLAESIPVLGDDQEVCGSLATDVPESHAPVIFEENLRRNLLAGDPVENGHFFFGSGLSLPFFGG